MQKRDLYYANDDFAELSQEDLYYGLVSGTLPDEAVVELFCRLRSLIYRMSASYIRFLPMDFDDISQEAILLLWVLVKKNRFRSGEGKFSSFYASCWGHRLINLYRDYVIKNPVPCLFQPNVDDQRMNGVQLVQWSNYIQKKNEIRREYNQRYSRRKREGLLTGRVA